MAFIQSQKDLRFVSEKSFILLLSLISLRILSQEWNFNFIKSSSKLTEKIISIFFFSPFGLFKWKTVWLLLFGHSVVSNSLWPHGLQHARLPCPSLSPGVCSNSCPLSWWCHPTISSSVVPFPPTLKLSQHQGLFQWVGPWYQVAKVLEFQHQSFQWIFKVDFLKGLTGLILKSRGILRVFSSTTDQKHQFFCAQRSL